MNLADKQQFDLYAAATHPRLLIIVQVKYRRTNNKKKTEAFVDMV